MQANMNLKTLKQPIFGSSIICWASFLLILLVDFCVYDFIVQRHHVHTCHQLCFYFTLMGLSINISCYYPGSAVIFHMSLHFSHSLIPSTDIHPAPYMLGRVLRAGDIIMSKLKSSFSRSLTFLWEKTDHKQ